MKWTKRIGAALCLMCLSYFSMAAVPSSVSFDFGGDSRYADTFATGEFIAQDSQGADSMVVILPFVPSLVKVWVANTGGASVARTYEWFTGMGANTCIASGMGSNGFVAAGDSFLASGITTLDGTADVDTMIDGEYLIYSPSTVGILWAGGADTDTARVGFRIAPPLLGAADSDVVFWYALP